MRVKWNRHLDGIRPLITVPETDVISNGKLEDQENYENNTSFTDLNDNKTETEAINSRPQNGINSTLDVRVCDSPCPSSASITSKRSDKSRRISSLFGLFRVKDRVINDNNSEDCVSNASELSNTTVPSIVSMHSISSRKSRYGSRDSINMSSERIGFEADTRRRRRANSLLAKSSMRRSWQQLNANNKLPLVSGYVVMKERMANYSHSSLISLSGKASEPELLIKSPNPQNRNKSEFSPEVKVKNEIKDEEVVDVKIKTETNISPESNCDPILDSIQQNDCKEIQNNSIFVMQTDVQTLESQPNCIAPSDLRGCDGVDNKVENCVQSLNSSQNLLNNSKVNSKIIFDPKKPKNNFKNIKNQQNFKSDKTEANSVCNKISKNIMQTNSICVTQSNKGLDSSAEHKDIICIQTDETTHSSLDQIDGSLVSNKSIEIEINCKPNDSLHLKQEVNYSTNNEKIISSVPPSASITCITPSIPDIVKVKVKQLPESEVVCFSSQILSSPSSASQTTSDVNDGAVVLTFINDEPMTREALDKRNTKSDALVKSTPIQGILRVRGTESKPKSEDNNSNGLTKSQRIVKSAKKVHFADNCLQNRNSIRGRTRIVKPRQYGSYGVVTVNDKKTSNRRPTQANTTGSSQTVKRMTNTKINASNANSTKRDVRSAQVVDDKQQIQKLTQLCETKTKQLKANGLDQNYTRLAFDSLSVVIQHLIEQYEVFENPKLKRALRSANQRCEQLKGNLDEKDLELNDMKIIFEEQINQLMKEREKNYSDLNQAKVSHQLNVKKLKAMHSSEVKRLEDKYNKELELSQQNCNQLLNEIQEKSNEFIQTKQLKEDLEVRVKQMEENIMNDKDKRFKYLTEKSKQLELEVESLKVVMDMKNEKIHVLERKMIETQEKINELPFAKENIRSLQQQIETLQITLDRKIHAFNQLTREHEELKGQYEKEMREKRRLSMKNEELAFHLSESFNESMSGLNSCPNFDPNHHRFKSQAINIDETPIKTNRTINMNSGQALMSGRRTHSKANRSISISNSTSNSSVSTRGTPALHCPSSGSISENHFLNNSLMDEVFDSGTGFTDCNRVVESNKKSVKRFERFAISSETPPQCILDSGFEEIQGLNSLPK